jgi:WD40 repeat protein
MTTTPLAESDLHDSQGVDVHHPWPGLSPYTESLTRFFHGRSREVEDLLRRVRRKVLTILFGQSGLGKTSLLQAGLFPKLRQEGMVPVLVRLDHAAEAPPAEVQIKAAIQAALATADLTQAAGPSAEETLWEYFHHADAGLTGKDGKPVSMVLVFDQFEELFTLGQTTPQRRARAAEFVQLLAGLVENRAPATLEKRLEDNADEAEKFSFDRQDLRILLCLREDYLAQLEGLREAMPSLAANRMRLNRMNGTQALEAVIEPAAGLVEREVAGQIVRFVAGGRPGRMAAGPVPTPADDLTDLEVEPSLLSLVCRELNSRRLQERLLHISFALLAGSSERILQDYYERCMADQPAAVRAFVEDELLTDSGFRENMALERARKSLLQRGAAPEAIDLLVKRRLLHVQERLNVQRVELTHDVLTDVIGKSRDARQQRERVRALRRRLRQTRIRVIVVLIAFVVLGGVAFEVWSRTQLSKAYEQEKQAKADADKAQKEANTSAAHAMTLAKKEGEARQELQKISERLRESSYFQNLSMAELTWQRGEVTRPRKLLQDCEPLYRHWEWHYLQLLTEPEVQTLQGHKGKVRHIAFSPDGRSLASASLDKTVQVWDLAGSTPPLTLQHSESVKDVVIAADGRIITIADNGSVHLWDAQGQKLQPSVKIPEAQKIVVSGDGRRVATTSADTQLKIWDAAASQVTSALTQPDLVNRAMFSPAGDRLALAIGRTIKVVTVAGGNKPIVLQGSVTPVSTVLFSPDGRRLASVDDRNILVWDLNNPGKPLVLARHTLRINTIAFRPDGLRLASGSDDKTVREWDLVLGEEVNQLPPQADYVDHVAYSHDGSKLATGCFDGMLKVWDVAAGQAILSQRAHPGGVTALAFSPDATRLASAGTDKTFKLWDVPLAKILLTGSVQDDGMSRMVFSADGERLAEIINKTIRIRNGRTGRLVYTLPQLDRVAQTAFSPDGLRLTVTCADGTARVWDMESTKPLRDYSEPRDQTGDVYQTALSSDGRKVLFVRSASKGIGIWDLSQDKQLADAIGARERVALLAFSPDGQRLASANEDGTVKIWDAADGNPLGSLRLQDLGGGGFVPGDQFHLAFSKDHQRLALANWSDVKIVDANTGRIVTELRSHNQPVTDLAFSPDGKRVASASKDQTIKLWDLDRGQELRTITGFTEEAAQLLFSADGSLLAANSASTIKVWEVASGREELTLNGHAARVNHVAFSPDGRRLASASDDGSVKLWTLAGPKQLLTFAGHTQPIVDLAFSRDGRRLASAAADKSVRIWEPGTGRQIAAIEGSKTAIKQVVFDPNDSNRLVLVSQPGAVQIVDATTGKELASLQEPPVNPELGALIVAVAKSPDAPGPLLAATALRAGHTRTTGWINHVAFHPDGGILAVADERVVKIWDTVGRKKLRELRGHAGRIYRLAWAPHGKFLASAGDNQVIYVWDGSTGQRVGELQGPAGRIAQLHFSPDGQKLAALGESQDEAPVRLWDLSRAGQALLLRCSRANDITFSPDSRRLVTASAADDNAVNVWDTYSGALVAALKGHTAPVTRVSFGPEAQGSRLVSASEDKKVKIWDIDAGREVLTLRDHSAPVSQLVFSPDGKCLASAGEDNVVRTWETSFDLPSLTKREHAWQVALATSKVRDKQWFAAEFHLTQLLEEPDADAALYSQRAGIYAQQKRWDAALADYRTAVRKEPGKSRHYYNQGMALLGKGDMAGFRALCAEMVQRFAAGADAATADDIVWLAVLDPQGVRDFQALVQLERDRAVKANPDSANYLENLGAASFRAGDYASALQQLGQAVAKNGKGGTVWMQSLLAMVHHELKHPTEAQLWLARAARQFVDKLADPKDMTWTSRLRWDRILQEAQTRTGQQAFVFQISDRFTAADVKDNNSKAFKKDYLVRLAAGTEYQITMSPSQDIQDPILRLEDSAGNQVEFKDSYGKSDARIQFACKQTDTYRIVATTFSGAVGKFTVTVLAKTRVTQAIALKNGKGQVEGQLTDLELSAYTVHLARGKSYRIDFARDKAPDNATSTVRLLNSTGTAVAADTSTATARIIFACASAGDYRIAPDPYEGGGRFTLLIEEGPPLLPPHIVVAEGKARVPDRLTLEDRKDSERIGSFAKVYTVDLAGGKTYLMQMIREPTKAVFEPYLHVEDPFGKRVAADDSYGLTAAQVVVTCKEAGSFRVSATTFEKGIGNFTLVVQEWARVPEVNVVLKDGVARLDGQLDANDLKDRAHPSCSCKQFLLKMAAGKLYEMEMSSSTLDVALRMEQADGTPLKVNDNSARITFRSVHENTYRIIASTVKPQTGMFTLTIHEKELPVLKLAVKGGKAEIKDELTKSDVKDLVRTGSYSKTYVIALTKGKTYQIDMKSDKMDSFLRLEDDKGGFITEDDDSGGMLNARIVWSCTQSGTYRIMATTYRKAETGSYTLTVQEK